MTIQQIPLLLPEVCKRFKERGFPAQFSLKF